MVVLNAFWVSVLFAVASARTQLTDGTSGTAVEGPGYTTMGALLWQSSGVLYDGCTDSAAHPIDITDCYALQLSADATKNLQDNTSDSPRQRIEFLTKGAADGTSWSYQWKYYLSSQTGTTDHFFHVMQLLTRGGAGGPVITLEGRCRSRTLTTIHSMTVTYGPKGSVKYAVKDSSTGKTLLSYSATGSMGSESTSLKFGTYRQAVAGITVSL